MTSIGGFLPLETGCGCGGAGPYHASAAPLTTGRACWHLIVRTVRPRRVRLPFFICDAMVQPLAATRTPFEFYPIDEAFRPVAAPAPEDGELVVIVNYFGVQTRFVEEQQRALGQRVVIDDTQAFFRRGSPDAWSFNSARKFFGVPDGAYLYGPAASGGLPPSDLADCAHLQTRLEGDGERAWELFKQREARVGIEPRAMSDTSARVLGRVDAAEARRRRVANFTALHERLGGRNRIALPLDDPGDGPLCYPFLAGVPVARAVLSRLALFVPIFWPELDTRSAAGFAWERGVAQRLLPLPIDHRYGVAEMQRVADVVLQVLP